MQERILLLTHGGWGSALLRGVEMVIGKMDFVDEIALGPQDTFSEFENKVEAWVTGKGQDEENQIHITIFTDMFGGTPTNAAIFVARRHPGLVSVITGVNAPVLLEACSQVTFCGGLDIRQLLKNSEHSIFDAMEKIHKEGVQ